MSREVACRLHEWDRTANSRTHVSSYVALALSALADRDGAFCWLEHGLDERDYSMLILKTYPNYDPPRSAPRFQVLLRRMKFPE